MTVSNRVVVVGSVMTDMTVYLDRVPSAGETLLGRSFTFGHGGKGANQAVMAALLGAEVELVACVGDDDFGTRALDNLAEVGITALGVRRVANVTTGVAPIWVDAAGENRIVIVPGANNHMTPAHVEAAFARVPAPDVVICQLEIPLDCVERALALGQDVGAVTILNPAPIMDVGIDVLRRTSWLVPNESEFQGLRMQLLGADDHLDLRDAVQRVSTLLGAGLVVTLGASGALLCAQSEAEVQQVDAPKAVVVDTSGAGDAFVGAFAYALGGTTMPPSKAVRFACACASRSVERRGTQSSFPAREEFGALLEGSSRSGPAQVRI